MAKQAMNGAKDEGRRAVIVLLAAVAVLTFFVFDELAQEGEEQVSYSSGQIAPPEVTVKHRAVPVADMVGETGENALKNPFSPVHEKHGDSAPAELLPEPATPQGMALPPLRRAMGEIAPVPAEQSAAARGGVPTLSGIATDGDTRLVVLSDGHKSAILSVGESFAGWEVTAIGDNAATIEKDGQLAELSVLP